MLNEADLERYARQVIMPDIGEDGQQRLLDAKVLVVGAGGLGAPVIMYLAAAGVGNITIVDNDTVARTDLNRQLIHTTSSVGSSKVKQAAASASALNPDIHVSVLPLRLSPGNASKLVTAHHVIIDCSDNARTRYLLGDLVHQAKVPLVFGGAVRTEGQVSVFQSNVEGHVGSPCFRCVFPGMPDKKQAASCSEVGIIGAVTGVIGSMQAMEAIKLITGIGSTLTSRLLLLDALNMSVMEIETMRRDDCLCCGGGGGGGGNNSGGGGGGGGGNNSGGGD